MWMAERTNRLEGVGGICPGAFHRLEKAGQVRTKKACITEAEVDVRAGAEEMLEVSDCGPMLSLSISKRPSEGMRTTDVRA